MFEETMRKLRSLERATMISVKVELDDDGYLDRLCPNSECKRAFKVLMEDWKTKVADARVYCPFCRHERRATAWNTKKQSRSIADQGVASVQKILGEGLSADARRFNQEQRARGRRSRGLFDVSMSLEYKPGRKPVIIPAKAAEELRQRFACEECGCRYASLGASFFCPACGHNSVLRTFDATVETVRKATNLRGALAGSLDADSLEDAVRQTLEDQFPRLVGAFERFSEGLFSKLANESQHPRQGAYFQRIDDGSNLWFAATGSAYEVFLSPTEIARLKLLFQQRHVLGHNQGIVDQSYLDRSGDTSYSVGQRLVIRETDVLELADLVSRLGNGLRSLVP